MNRRLLFIPLLVLALVSCSHTRNATATKPEEKTAANNNLAQLRTAVQSSAPQFDWIRSRGTMHYEDESQKISANTVMKMRNDSLIWASVNVLIEVARGMVTQDSAVIMNRTARSYTVYPVSGLQALIGIPGLNLKALQSLLLAYPPFGIAENSKLENRNNSYYVENTTPAYKEDFDIDPKLMRLTRYHYARNNSEQVTVTYSDFRTDGKLPLPQKIEFALETPAKILISLDVTDYNFLQADEAPFSIPASYSKSH